VREGKATSLGGVYEEERIVGLSKKKKNPRGRKKNTKDWGKQ